jgi:hypothetical protein
VRGGSLRCTTGLGKGDDILCVRCRAGVGALRCRRNSACAGTWHTRCALWAARSCRGGVHGWSKAWASRGIDSWGEGEASGEVIARGGVGGVLTKHGVLGGNGDV